MMAGSFRLGRAEIGDGCRCFIIAEAGVNHNGDEGLALRLVDAAAAAGADAVKFQSFLADRLTTADAAKAPYQLETTGRAGTQRDMLAALELSRDAHRTLKARCEDRGVVFLSTPFDEASADMLESLDVAAFKIPSGEVTNALLLEHIARKRRPIVMSTGMATLDEVRAAVRVLRDGGTTALALLQCTSAYPARPASANLSAMETMSREFAVPVGYSDHTLGLTTAIAAVAMGASIVEKHLTLDRTLPGPDHRASLEPDEFAALVRAIREVESAIGTGVKAPAPEEAAVAAVARRSLVSARPLSRGEVLDRSMVAAKRPAGGASPMDMSRFLGRRLRRDVSAEAPLADEMFE